MAKEHEIDEELAASLKQAKTKPMKFVLVMKGGADGALLLSKTKIAPAAIAEAKKKSGGSAVIQGRCFYEEGVYVFEMGKSPPATADRIVKVVAKRDAGLTVQAEFRMSMDPELAEEPATADASASAPAFGSTPPAMPAPVVPAKPLEKVSDTWNKRIAEITPQLKQALATGGAAAAPIRAAFVKAQATATGGDFGRALSMLPAIEKLLNELPATAPSATASASPSEPSAASPPPPAKPLAEWQSASKMAAAQVVQLLGVLRKTGIPALSALGDEMLATVRKYVTAMQTVLADYEKANAEGTAAAAAKALQLAKACETRIAAEKTLIGVDTNPFGVAATVRGTLAKSLKSVTSALAAAS